MKVELYLKSINQEMIDLGRPVKSQGSCDVYGSWKVQCCILDFGKHDPKNLGDPAQRGYLLRKEKEGGMFWDPRTGSVYKVDDEAYHTMIELDHGLSEREVARRMNVPVTSVTSLVSQLNKIVK